MLSFSSLTSNFPITPLVRWSDGRLVGWSVIISLQDEKLHFHVPIGALICHNMPQIFVLLLHCSLISISSFLPRFFVQLQLLKFETFIEGNKNGVGAGKADKKKQTGVRSNWKG